MTGAAVLDLIDAAQPFAELEPLTGDELRRAGLAALDQACARLKAAQGDGSTAALEEAAREAGSITAAGAADEAFAKALLSAEAAGAGLIKAIGAKAVNKAIVAAMKMGAKNPRSFSKPIMSQPRPGEAGNSAAVHVLSSPEDHPVAVAAAPAPPRPPDSDDPPISSPPS